MAKPNHNSSGPKLKVGITIGDVNGIGPELLIHTFLDTRMREVCLPIIYGSSRVLNIYRKVLNVNKFHYVVIQKPSQAQYKKVNIIECVPKLERIEIGKAAPIGGEAAHLSLKRAIEDAQHGEIDALVTLPLDKASMQAHLSDFQGHTELLAQAFNVQDNLMFMVSDELKIGTVTNHLPLADVARNLSVERIVSKAKLMHESLQKDFSVTRPMIGILGLNPHAGDRGLLGSEETDIINHAVTELKKAGIKAMGPYPADGYFGAMTYKKFDGTLAMYHDQGLIPFKLLSGYRGVNYTAGMPLVRTSPDHGVAYDIAGKGVADPSSLRESIFLALDVHRHRKQSEELRANPLPPLEELAKQVKN